MYELSQIPCQLQIPDSLPKIFIKFQCSNWLPMAVIPIRVVICHGGNVPEGHDDDDDVVTS